MQPGHQQIDMLYMAELFLNNINVVGFTYINVQNYVEILYLKYNGFAIQW
jgi:hypothetical protein